MFADPYVAAHVPDQSQAKGHDGPRTGTYAIRTVYNVGNMTIHWKKISCIAQHCTFPEGGTQAIHKTREQSF